MSGHRERRVDMTRARDAKETVGVGEVDPSSRRAESSTNKNEVPAHCMRVPNETTNRPPDGSREDGS